MLRAGRPVGAIAIARPQTGYFPERQIELVRTFADQAVIAIENTRLLNELHQRTDDLSEALEQQTATSKVLQVISKSPGELEPVFETMLENAVRICGAPERRKRVENRSRWPVAGPGIGRIATVADRPASARRRCGYPAPSAHRARRIVRRPLRACRISWQHR